MLLDELTKIVRCKKETELTILLIFYDVDPSYIRKQARTFGLVFNKHAYKTMTDLKKVKRWRDALREVANISGWHYLPKRYFS